MVNEYGLDVEYFKKKLRLIVRDAYRYTPEELARELARLSVASNKEVIKEKEFNKDT